MSNLVREVANSKATAAPGWAYVPDTAINTSTAALQPSSRKRARNLQSASAGETTAKQDAKILRELIALDRENHRDVTIPVPVRHRDNAGRGSSVSHGKVTPAVRKILQSQKTFANYLADFEAQGSQSSYTSTAQPAPATSTVPVPKAVPAPKNVNAARRSRKTTSLLPSSVASTSQDSMAVKSEPSAEVELADAPRFSPGKSTIPAAHPGDTNPLLISSIPSIPSEMEIVKLLAEQPLAYNDAKGPWVDEDRRKPVRVFCERCGYWGRVRCTKCGARVCALECYNEHVEECLRYGA